MPLLYTLFTLMLNKTQNEKHHKFLHKICVSHYGLLYILLNSRPFFGQDWNIGKIFLYMMLIKTRKTIFLFLKLIWQYSLIFEILTASYQYHIKIKFSGIFYQTWSGKNLTFYEKLST